MQRQFELRGEVEERADSDALEAAAGGFSWADEHVDGLDEFWVCFV